MYKFCIFRNGSYSRFGAIYAKKYVLLLTENIANERIINRKNKRKHNGHSHHWRKTFSSTRKESCTLIPATADDDTTQFTLYLREYTHFVFYNIFCEWAPPLVYTHIYSEFSVRPFLPSFLSQFFAFCHPNIQPPYHHLIFTSIFFVFM